MRSPQDARADRPQFCRVNHFTHLSWTGRISCRIFHEVVESCAQAKIPDDILSATRGSTDTPNSYRMGFEESWLGTWSDVCSKDHVATFHEVATRPFQHTLSTGAGCETMTDAVNASDFISRRVACQMTTAAF